MIENILDGVLALFPEIGFFIDVISHLCEMAKGLLIANIHTGLDQDLSLQNFFIQFFLRFCPNIFPRPIGHE